MQTDAHNMRGVYTDNKTFFRGADYIFGRKFLIPSGKAYDIANAIVPIDAYSKHIVLDKNII